MRSQKGFTLVELMIVVTVIGVLAAIVIPKFSEMIARAHYVRTGSWPENYRGPKDAFQGPDGNWYGGPKPKHLESQDETPYPQPRPTPTTVPAPDPVEFKEVSRRDVTYYYDARSRLCFAQMNNGIVVVPCSSLGIK